MTIQAIEGRLEIPPAANQEAADLGFAATAIPPGIPAITERFYPNPANEAGQTAIFNLFLVSIDFAGDVYLVKYAPRDSEHFTKRAFRPIRLQSELKWTLAPSEAVADSVQEPENGTSYALVMFGETPGQHIYYRMSL